MAFQANGGFGGFNRANNAALLQQQISDQQQAQKIFAQIGRSQQQHQFQMSGLGQAYPMAQAPIQYGQQFGGPQPQGQQINTFQQMSMMMNMLAQMMQAMSMVGQGFSSFMGGGRPY